MNNLTTTAAYSIASITVLGALWWVIERLFKRFSLLFNHPLNQTAGGRPISTEYLGLKTLYTPSEKTSLDIVAVHGIGADPYYSWVTKGTHWLKDAVMLPERFANARIMSFGYESQWFGENAVRTGLSSVANDFLADLQETRKDCPDRPLIFIGHCFGGLVIQQALLTARVRQQHLSTVFDHTIGVLFLGTPFRGTGEIISQGLMRSLTATGYEVQSAVLRHLSRDDESLGFLVQEFTRVCKENPAISLNIVCIYEQKSTGVGAIVGNPNLKEFVVDKTSGSMDGYPSFGFARDHFQLNKFSGSTDIYYKRVVRELMGMYDKRNSKPPSQQSPRKPLFTVPFERDKRFVGRDGILGKMDEKFKSQRRLSLHGLGGVGKSQIAIEFAYKQRDLKPQMHIIWLYTATDARFRQACRDIGREINLPNIDDSDVDACGLVRDWLSSEESGEWLLILDNADDEQLFFSTTCDNLNSNTLGSSIAPPLADYLPAVMDDRRSLLITSRNRPLAEDLSNGYPGIEVEPFSTHEARRLLHSRSGRSEDECKDGDADALLALLGHIPLAISQAAAFINRNQMSVCQYRERLAKGEQNIKAYLHAEHRDPRRERDIPNAVFQTWKISFDQIRNQDNNAAMLLSLMVMLDREGIPKSLVQQTADNDLAFDHAMGTLSGFSLITMTEDGKVVIHRLVQLSVHAWLEQHGQRASREADALALMSERFPFGKHENQKLCETLVPHALAVLRCNFLSHQDLVRRATLLYNLGRYYIADGSYCAAYSSATEAYEIQVVALGSDNAETANTLALQGLATYSAGNYKESEGILREAMRSLCSILGTAHPDTLICTTNLAWALQDQKKHHEAELVHRQAFEGYEKALGPDHADTLNSLYSLAWALFSEGKVDEAEKMFQQTCAGFAKTKGKAHPWTLNSVQALARVLRRQGKFKEAEEKYRSALDLFEKEMGLFHPYTINCLHALALLLEEMKNYSQSSWFYERALEGYKKTLGEAHPDALACAEEFDAMKKHSERES